MLNGYGRIIFTAGQYYEGDFKNDNKHGFGRKVYTNGEIKEGMWEDGNFIGAAT